MMKSMGKKRVMEQAERERKKQGRGGGGGGIPHVTYTRPIADVILYTIEKQGRRVSPCSLITSISTLLQSPLSYRSPCKSRQSQNTQQQKVAR